MGKSAGGGVGSPGPRRCGDPEGWVGRSPRGEALASGRGAASRGRLEGIGAAAPRWPAGRAPPSRPAQPRRGRRSHRESPLRASQPATGPGGDRAWRWSLEVWSRGTPSLRSGRAWLKSYRYGPVLVTVVAELPIGAAPSQGGGLKARGGAARLVAARLGPGRSLGSDSLDAANPASIPVAYLGTC